MINEQGRHHHHDHSHCGTPKCISWTAIIVGAIVGVGLSFLLNVYSVAISLSVFSMGDQGATFAVGGLIGVIIGVVVGSYVAGWVAGYLGRPYCPKRNLGILYGFVTWCIAFILSTLLAAKMVEHTVAYSNFITTPSNVVVADMTNVSSVGKTKPAQQHAKTMLQQNVVPGLSLGAFIVFILFYIGAFSCCVGGYYGMLFKGDDEYKI